MVVVQIILCIFIADFLSGIIHWMEDSYGDSDWPVVGLYLTRPNILHHYDPRHFVKNNTWFGRAKALAIISLVIIAVAASCKLLSWQLIFTLLIGANANESHKSAHCSPHENGPVIAFFQKLGVMQSPAHHAKHHQGTRDTHYCVITNYLNPILESINFWRNVERVLFTLFRLEKRVDPTLEVVQRVAVLGEYD